MGAQQCLAAENTREYQELEILAKLREELDFDERKRKVLMLGATGCGKSTLIAAIKRRFRRPAVTVRSMKRHRQAWFQTIKTLIDSLCIDLAHDLSLYGKEGWTAAKIEAWRESFPEEEYSVNQAIPMYYFLQHSNSRPPPRPSSIGPKRHNEAALVKMPESEAKKHRQQYELEDMKYYKAYSAFEQSIADERNKLRPQYWTKLCRELDEKCTELLAEPVVRRWLSNAGERGPLQPLPPDSICGTHLPHINGLNLLSQRAIYLDQKKWDALELVPTEARIVAADGSYPDVTGGGDEAAAAMKVARALYAALPPDAPLMTRERTQGIQVENVYFNSWNTPNDWLRLQFVDVAGSRPDRKKWIHCFDDVSHIVVCVALDQYNTALYEDNTKNALEECCELWNKIMANRVFRQTKVVLVFTRLDVFELKYRAVGVSPPDPTAHIRSGFFDPLFKKLQSDSKSSAAGAVPKPDADTVLRYIIDQFRQAVVFDANVLPYHREFQLPVVVLNSLDGKSAEFVARLIQLNDPKWTRSLNQHAAIGASAAAKATAEANAAAVAAAAKRTDDAEAPPTADLKQPAPPQPPQPVASIAGGGDAAAAKPYVATWKDVRTRVLAAAATDEKSPLHLAAKCPFLFPSGHPPPTRGTFHANAESLPAGAHVPVPNHPIIPPIFMAGPPPAPDSIPDLRGVAEWQSPAEFERFLSDNVNLSSPNPNAPGSEKVEGVNLWILRSLRVWAPDRAVHLQFPVPFRRAVRTILLIWSRRRRAAPADAKSDVSVVAAPVLLAHPLSRLPRDVLFRIVHFFADMHWIVI